jgi:hypothetical protein
MSVWYDPKTNTIEIWRQRMMDEWVLEAVGFYSPQYSLIAPYQLNYIYIGELD